MNEEIKRNKIVGSRVKEIRRRFNLTQTQLSEVIGSNSAKNQYVRMIEHGDRNLTEKNIRRIAEAFNVLPEYLRLETDFMTWKDKMKSMLDDYKDEQDIRGKYFEMLFAKHGFTIRYQFGNQTFSRFQDCVIVDGNNDSVVLTEEELYELLFDFEAHFLFQVQRKIDKEKYMLEEEKHMSEDTGSSFNPEEE